jgi:Zn-dependent M28 family amino/carboxypeptidase
VLLAMADALKKRPPAIGVDLLFVDGEDYGTFSPEVDVLLGSKYYAANQPAGGPPEFAVLLDLVGGQRAQFRREGNSVIGAPSVVDHLWETASRMGYGNLFLPESGGSSTDDHVPLQQVGIRAIDVIGEYGPGTSYPWWHTTEDTVDKLSADILKGVGDVMIGVIRQAKRIE